MEAIRIALIILHVLVTACVFYHLHPHLSSEFHQPSYEQNLAAIVGFLTELVRINLYHAASIIVIWQSRRYGAGAIRASGLLLIGEILQIISIVVQHAMETHHVTTIELLIDVFSFWFLLAAIVLSFLLAKEIIQHQKDLMQVELLATTGNDTFMDGRGDFSLV